ncbi:restriction endonuclease subunit S [Aphanizomenon flos-aquae NRERC-008]|uniref:Restriction endonuclease subunit S n=1 Tax=Aphanizomenon flos-aquae FACHB-1249 TaxID=2692889 RepID=A0ABR8IRX3_APHFL|nr:MULTISPECIES: restriction endonuclease subunit S [Aphanizomenon]MBD2389790.1 restriction endonuclease subunit S [Aphanizomenon flos-aquae FACHB-1171]MBD2557542.1 restriction endonuclease subunit S [Aphanizomenon flos-aquae FACHB-1290]MBD2631328.1 restriction endonuclease subunit S [Aphanizomenon sp. FACHB-1399]MBD2643028.1 restriction endonuclease subunit S [Aphanizomenon sp. FACHB-1401]MBD2656023.1 restriction endonuclease subunit S [Aphanizomenon flos-aquae FACHB-1265]
MKLETFFKHFDLLAEAPNGVQKLRELILDLAVRGKLVPQDANDEPAAVLLERIKKEKERLVKEKIQKVRTTSKIDNSEIPFELPKNWMWVNLDSYVLIVMGQSPDSTYYNNHKKGLPFYQGKSDFNNLYPTPRVWCEIPLKIAEENDILISVRAPVGSTNICQEKSCIGRGLAALRSIDNTNNFYLLYFLRAFEKKISEMGVGSTFKAISKTNLETFKIAVPPLNEQKRIVIKVDELMKLCDELEARQKKKQETRILINNAALNKLLTAETPETFTKNWQRISDNFDILYSAPENIGKLRQAILQLAVMGKLVPQNANDEPAAVLLERIKKEKERLVKEGKVKKEKSLPAIKDDEIPYDLPIGWEWVRLGEICSFFGGYAFKSDSYVELSSNQVIRLGNVKNDKIMLEQSPVYITDEIAFENEKFLIRKGDILITMTGTKNKRDYCFTSVVEDKHIADKNLYLNQRVGSLRISETLFIQLVNIFLKSSMILDLLFSSETGTANQGNIGVDAIRNLPFPLPPLAEQKRIVTKVDKLMKLCDELETKLTQTQTEREKIINAAVKQLLTV